MDKLTFDFLELLLELKSELTKLDFSFVPRSIIGCKVLVLIFTLFYLFTI